MGLEFETMSPDIDEKSIRDTDPVKLVLAIARAKAEALTQKVKEPCLLITSDQVTLYNGEIREKPVSAEQAREFLRSYSIAPVETISAVVVTNTGNGKQVEGTDRVTIHFKTIPEAVIDTLIAEGDVMYCAGGFIVEHPLLQPLIKQMDGEMDSVMGLPGKLTEELLKIAQN